MVARLAIPTSCPPERNLRPMASPEPARRDSSDDDENDENDAEAHVATSRKRKRPRNPFILDEAADAAKGDEEDYKLKQFDTEYNDYEFIDDY